MPLTLHYALTSVRQSLYSMLIAAVRSCDFWWPQNGWKQLKAYCSLPKGHICSIYGKGGWKQQALFRERGQRERSSGRTVCLLQTGWIITLIIQPVVIVETWRRVINCLCKCEFPWGRWRPSTQGEEKHAHDPIKNNHDPATYSIRAEPRAHAHAVFKKAPQVLSWHDRCW